MLSNYLHICLINRFSYVHYGNVSTNYPSDEEAYYSLTEARNETFNFWEPTVNFEFGLPKVDWVKLSLGSTMSFDGSGKIYPYCRTYNAFIGANFDLLKLKKKK